MGNYISCSLASGPGNHSRDARVILPDGSIRQVDGPANAAELMLDVPGHFVVNSCSMEVGRRFSPLAADEELEMAKVYVMLPMGRVNSVVSAADVGRLLLAAGKAVKRARVLPSSQISPPAERQEEQRLKLDEIGDMSVIDEFKCSRSSMCRSRRPMLETIVEESLCSR